jgi:hypothetical protein
MPRNIASESEFGLPSPMPDPFGNPIAEDAVGAAKITGLTDADAVKAGAGGDGSDLGSMSTMGAALRAIYATPDDTFGTGPAVLESTFAPVVKE